MGMAISGRAYDIILAKDSTDFVLKSWFDTKLGEEGLAPRERLCICLNPVGGERGRGRARQGRHRGPCCRMPGCLGACLPGRWRTEGARGLRDMVGEPALQVCDGAVPGARDGSAADALLPVPPCPCHAPGRQPPSAPRPTPKPACLQPFGKNNSLADKFVRHAAMQFQPRLIVSARRTECRCGLQIALRSCWGYLLWWGMLTGYSLWLAGCF